MRRRSSDTARRAGLIAVAVALAAALAAAGARLAGRSSGRTHAAPKSPQTYTCRCGATYRVSGIDRHRVYWPAGAPDDKPVLGDSCVECEARLPG